MEMTDEAQPPLWILDDAGYDGLVGDGQGDELLLSEKEELVLQLYDQIKQLELERSLLEAQRRVPGKYWNAFIPPTVRAHLLLDLEYDPVNIEGKIKVAERELLEAQATYSIRRKVEESVMKANPTLKAVHATEAATIPQRLLFPLLNRRDILSLLHENIAKKVSATEQSLSKAEVENMKVTRKNQELVQELLELTSNAKTQRGDIDDEELKGRLESLESENKTRRARWRTLKAVVGSVIVGSGVDWARNEELCSLVMDEE